MTSKKKYIVVGFIVIIAAAAAYGYREYSRKPADLNNVTAVAKMSAANLVSEFNENENAANNKYLGKIIEVTGPVAEVNNEQDTVINISLGSNEELHKVSCRMDSRHFSEAKKYSEGNIITIKGTCDGFLMDVELNRCVISKDQ
jgi:hypothetical protein